MKSAPNQLAKSIPYPKEDYSKVIIEPKNGPYAGWRLRMFSPAPDADRLCIWVSCPGGLLLINRSDIAKVYKAT